MEVSSDPRANEQKLNTQSGQFVGDTTPLISVIVPVYNVAPYLRRCIDSLLAQTFSNFELILVDDGSTDGSSQICDEYGNEEKNKKTRVSVIHQPNAGVSAARNRGMEAARGYYISFVDADDWVEPRFLEAFAKAADEREPDIVVQGFVDHEDLPMTWPASLYSTHEELCSHLFEMEQRHLIGYVWNKVFRHAVIQEHQLRFDPTIPIGEDFVFVMTYLRYSRSLAVTPHVGYHYFFSGDKVYSFTALNKRLDCFHDLLPSLTSMPATVKEAFLLKEFQFSLYILHVLYREFQPYHERQTFLRKVRAYPHDCKTISLFSLKHPYSWLAMIVVYLPVSISDIVLRMIYRR